MQKNLDLRRMIVAAIFTALAYVSMFVPFFNIKVQFLTFDMKDAFMTVGAMAIGPLYAAVMSLIVSFIELVTISGTGWYGFLMNFISSAVFSVTATVIYKYHRKLSGAILGLVSAVLATTAAMLLFNLVVTPYYLGSDIQTVAAMIPALLLPFNLTKCILNAALVMLLYKPISTTLRRSGLLLGSSQIRGQLAFKKTKSLPTSERPLLKKGEGEQNEGTQKENEESETVAIPPLSQCEISKNTFSDTDTSFRPVSLAVALVSVVIIVATCIYLVFALGGQIG